VALCGVAAVPALAADMPLKAPPMVVAPPASWSGCYVGANVGAAWSHTYVHDEVAPFGPIATLDDTAVAGGGQIGCDYQVASSWVIGVQAMYDGTGLASDATSPVLAPLTLHGQIPWFATLTGRIGFAISPSAMIYAKGGAAWTHTDSSLLFDGVVVDTANFDQSGWTAGGGVEWKINPRWSVFAEYDYLGFDDKLVTSASGANLGIVHQNVQTALVGLNLRFGPFQ
jgi:outer membrane immunogenic protein